MEDLKKIAIKAFSDGDPVKPVRKSLVVVACRICTLLNDPKPGELRQPTPHDKSRFHTDTVETDRLKHRGPNYSTP